MGQASELQKVRICSALWGSRDGGETAAVQRLRGLRQLGESLLDRGADLQRPVEVRALVSGHHAGAQEGAARRDGGVEGDVGVEALIPEGLPEQGCLHVVANHYRDYRRHDLRPVREPGWL